MKKIMVIGCPGSGKSTFSRALHNRTGIPLFHLDMLYWNPDKTTVEKNLFLQRLQEILNTDQWILDGNYNSTMALRMQACDTVIFLDYPLEMCLAGLSERQGKIRSDMPWVEADGEDPEFIRFVQDFPTQSRPQILELLGKHPEKQCFIFHDRTQAAHFLSKARA